MVSDESLRNGKLTWVNHLSEMRAFKMHLKIAFSNFDPSWNQTDLWTLIFKFYRDIHLQDFEDLSSFRYKIKFAKCHFGSEKTYIEYTCNVSSVYMSRSSTEDHLLMMTCTKYHYCIHNTL